MGEFIEILTTFGPYVASAGAIIMALAERKKAQSEANKLKGDAAHSISSAAISLVKPLQERITFQDYKIEELRACVRKCNQVLKDLGYEWEDDCG